MPLVYRFLWRPEGVRAGVAGMNLPLQVLGTEILSLARTSSAVHRCLSSSKAFFLNMTKYSRAIQHSQPFLSFNSIYVAEVGFPALAL